MSLASQIRNYRQAKKLSISELARRSNVSRSYITELERQGNKQPSAEKLYRIAEVLDTTIEELLEKSNNGYEEAILNLNKQIEGILQQASEPLQMLFQDIYKGKCDEEYKMILSKLVLIVQEDLPVAEMRYRGVGEE